MVQRYRFLITASYLAIIIGLTLAPVPVAHGPFSGLDKWVHALMFAGLAFMVYWAAARARSRLWIALAAGAVAAGVIELLQIPLVYRSGDLFDFVAGAAGSIFGTFAALALLSRSRPL